MGEDETPTFVQDENASPQSAGEQNNIEYGLASVQYRRAYHSRPYKFFNVGVVIQTKEDHVELLVYTMKVVQ